MFALLLGVGLLYACTSTQQEADAPITSAPPGPPFFIAADDAGAVIMDPATHTVSGYRRGQSAPVWTSEEVYDRKYFACVTQCPNVVASGTYTVVEGPMPVEFAAWIDTRGTTREDENAGYLWARSAEDALKYVPDETQSADDGPTGTVRYLDHAGRPIEEVAAGNPLWMMSRDGTAGVLRLSPSHSAVLQRTVAGWSTVDLPRPDLDIACLDQSHVVTGYDNEIFIDDERFATIDAEQIGFCDIWGSYLLTATLTNTTADGDRTLVELRSLDGSTLWSRSFSSLLVPRLSGPNGNVVVPSGGVLHRIDRSGVLEARRTGVTDVMVTRHGRLVLLTDGGNVVWR